MNDQLALVSVVGLILGTTALTLIGMLAILHRRAFQVSVERGRLGLRVDAASTDPHPNDRSLVTK